MTEMPKYMMPFASIGIAVTVLVISFAVILFVLTIQNVKWLKEDVAKLRDEIHELKYGGRRK